MCLGIPMQIVEIDGLSARCEARGAVREIGLLLLQDESPVAGDYVMVHLGNAIRKISEQEALSTWALLDEMLALESAGMNARKAS